MGADPGLLQPPDDDRIGRLIDRSLEEIFVLGDIKGSLMDYWLRGQSGYYNPYDDYPGPPQTNVLIWLVRRRIFVPRDLQGEFIERLQIAYSLVAYL